MKFSVLKLQSKKNLFFLPLCCFFIFSVFSQNTLNPPSKEKSVIVGYYEKTNFQEGAAPNQVKKGYAYDYLQKLGAYAGWSYEYVYGEYEDLYKKFIDGKIDLMAGLTKTEDKAGLVAFPALPMGNETYHFVKYTSNDAVSQNISTLNGIKIGITKGAIVEIMQAYFKEKKITAEIFVYDSDASRNYAFINEKIDVILTENLTSNNFPNTESFMTFTGADLYLCTTPGKKDILDQLNSGINSLYEEEPEICSILSEKYNKNNTINRSLTSAEKKWVNSHNELKVGYLRHYLPYCDEDTDGTATGIIKDLFPELLERLNLTDIITVTYYPYDNLQNMILDMRLDEINVIFPFGGGLYYAEQNGIYLSNPFLSVNMNLVHSGYYNPNNENSIAVNRNNLMQYYYVKTNFPNFHILFYNSIEDCLDAVKASKADATILNGLRVNSILKNNNYSNLTSVSLTNGDDRCFGVKIGNENLMKLLNHGLKLLESDYVLNTSYTYTDQLYKYTFSDFIKNNIVVIFLFIFGISVIVIVTVFTSMKKTRDAEQTARTTLKINQSLAKDFENIFLINLRDKSAKIVKLNGKQEEDYNDVDAETYDYDSFLEKYVEEQIHPDDRAMISAAMKTHIVANELQEKEDYIKNFRVINEDGLHHMQFKFTSIPETDDIILGVQKIDKMVEQEKIRQKTLQNALDAARNANLAKTVFLNSMSHDIRTPMNAIIGFTTLAETCIDDKDKVKEYLTKISTSSDHLLSLINDVLDMSRIESGKVKIEENGLDILDFIEDIKTIISPNIEAKNLKLTIETKEIKATSVVADKLRLNQVLLNILSNAIKFTPEGGSINISIKQKTTDSKGVADFVFKIKDSGIGMSQDFQKHIFEPFTREETSTVSGIQGTGLGMAITKNLVDMMGGNIFVESEEGKGSEFTVCLKFKLTEQKVKKVKKIKKEVDFTGKKLLLVEDNALNQEIALALLSSFGFEIDVANDGSIAVEKVQDENNKYDIILMDIQMPIMDGYEATRIIRHLKTNASKTPIVAMTANAFNEDKQKVTECGMDGHVAKPIDIKSLLETLSSLL